MNNTYLNYAKSKSIVELFEEQVLKTPLNRALIYNEENISYKQLNNDANCIADFLKEYHIGIGDFVVVIQERGIRLIESLLGIVKAGAAYVPIDGSYPKERIAYMLKDCQPKAIITDLTNKTVDLSLNDLHCIVRENGLAIPIIELCQISFTKDQENPKVINKPNDLFYVIYTSGTTGVPKGVMVTHQNINAYICAFKNEFHINESTVFLQQATYGFDIFTEEVYPTLLNGGTVCIVPEAIKLDFDKLDDYIDKNKVTMVSCSPLMLNEFHKKHACVKTYISGGDVLKKEYYSNLSGATIYNTYGPTETTVCATYYNCTQDPRAPIYIGKPIANTQIYIIKDEKLCDVGEIGELYIAGDGVARGYLHNPDLTSKKFINNPFGEGRVYKTGDLGKWTENGNIEFVGRKDEQVKIRGFRVELKEIETVIKNFEGIKDCAVLIKEVANGEKSIYAYIVADTMIETAVLRTFLEAKLPIYMFPAQIIQVSKIPMNINGKIDKESLLSCIGEEQHKYIAPKDEMEEAIAAMFSEVLNISPISADDNFFYLGGHSLRALRLINKIESLYGIRLNVKTIFEKKTVRELAKVLKLANTTYHEPIISSPLQSQYPMSSAQKQIYMISLIDETKISYNITEYLQISGVINRTKLEWAFQELVNRHEILRTSFHMEDDKFYQKVIPELHVHIESEMIDESMKDAQIKGFITAFDLSQPPLIQIKLFETSHSTYLVYDIHHIISDGMSIYIMLEELFKLYNNIPLEPLNVQYKDYCVWAYKKDIREQREYWLNRLSDEIPVLEMPTDYKRPLKQNFKGATLKRILPESIANQVTAFSKTTKTTEYMIFMSALMIMLMKYSRQEDILVGTPLANRVNKDTESMLGMFVNTLVLRGKPQKNKVYIDFLNEIKTTCFELYENQEYAFEELVKNLHIKRDVSRNPLFDVVLVLQNNENLSLSMDGTKTIGYETIKNETSKFDITFNIEYKEYGYGIDLEYCTELYKATTIERMFTHYCMILSEIIKNPYAKISEINMLTEDETSMILNTFNQTSTLYPSEQTVVELFEKQVSLTPDKIAVSYNEHTITYAQLNEKANSIAHKLRNMGIQKDDCVALLASKSITMIAGVLGIIKAGGAYVPIAPNLPKDRINYMTQNCHAKVILTYGVDFNVSNAKMIDLSQEDLYTDCLSNPSHINAAHDLIYVIYTSGTTGNPKGVMIEHKSVIRLVYKPNYVVLNEESVILQTGQMSFDASTLEVWGALLNGGTLILADEEVLLDNQQLEYILKEKQVNTLWLTSTLFNQMFTNNHQMFDTVNYLLIGGEKLSERHVQLFKQCNKHTTLINGYGPTESTTFTTTYTIPENVEEIPIGKPINQTHVYVVNDDRLCGIGVLGELWIGGDGLARGYLNNEKLTNEKFIKSPFSNERLYKSGDLVKWGEDGNIYYVGRIDEQVKIRGFRIELGEIDTAIRKINGIIDCAVVIKLNEQQDKAIYAYLVAHHKIDLKQLRQRLTEALPEYMLPAYMMQIDQIPITKNGKLDRRALPEINIRCLADYEAPKNEIEEMLCKVFSEVLNLEKVSTSASFYELGGDSIKAIRVVSKIRDLGYTTTASAILNLKTVQRLSMDLQKSVNDLCDQVEVSGHFEFTPIMEFFKEAKLAKPEHFNQSIMLEFHGANANAINATFTKIVEHHDVLRAVLTDEGMYIRKINEGKLYDYAEFEITSDDVKDTIYTIATHLQSSIDLENGPLVKLALFKLKDSQQLLIIIHHLVVDGVSWRIILEDFAMGYHQFLQNEPIKLPLKTTSYLKWSQLLKKYAQGERLQEELRYWLKVDEMIAKGGISHQFSNPSKYKDIDLVIDKESTSKLLTEIEGAYHASINDVLLTALGMAVHSITKQKYITIELEGHGREMVMEKVTIDRTVGWFTSIYPVVLTLDEDYAKTIANTKEVLRNIPSNGFGYNLLKYFRFTHFNTAIDVSFNYLGEFEENSAEQLKFSHYPCGDEISRANHFGRALGFDGLIKDEKLCFTVSYDEGIYCEEFIHNLVEAYKDMLHKISQNTDTAQYTEVASDYGFNEISVDDFEDILSAINDTIGE